MNPAAAGHFYTSAIPVKGDAFYGSGERAMVQGSGSGVGMDFGVEETDLTGHAFVQATSLTSDSNQQQVGLVQAYGQWGKWLIFGVRDSTFTDPNTMPDTFDLAGPAGRPAIYGSSTQPQIRYTLVHPVDPSPQPDDLSGFYGDVSIEMPGADVNLPSTTNYSTFSRFPDFVATIRYQAANVVGKSDDNTTKVAFERWHLQFGAVVRDLGVEGDGINVKPVVSFRQA
jgi:hypothetical protein